MTEPARTIDTPWGCLAVRIYPSLRGLDAYRTEEVAVRTPHGRAGLSLFVDADRDGPSDALRVLLTCGYSGGATTRALLARESTLDVGGKRMGWRLQAYVDPMTGGLVEDRPMEVMLADEAGRVVRGFRAAEDRVRDSGTAFLANAAEEAPGYAAGAYAAMATGVVEGIEADVEASRKALLDAEGRRDAAQARIDAVIAAIAGPTPRP